MPRTDAGHRRCAIYTRKSSEEGLEQEFNSLAAQREACEAYIRSQQHEGWVSAKTRCDDGGFSGGNLERPALQHLLADIRTGRIDIVVVYKVDRLTRALADFARLVEIFDAQAVSFVSVTQPFNTTSSMGRLTLNVLLSFAQFEREVTGERVRDKIAASKKKGIWMGGNVPLGYDADERALVINPAEAETMRRIFALYRELGCVRRVKEETDRLGLKTKRRRLANGAERGGASFSRGHIYQLLANPIYIGRIVHNGQLYPGQHPALIDDETWTAVRQQLTANAGHHHRTPKAVEPSLLAGLLVDARGERFTPSHAVKKGRRYRYYACTTPVTEAAEGDMHGCRFAAQEIEDCVISILIDALMTPARLLEALAIADIAGDRIPKLLGRGARLAATLRDASGERAKLIRALVERIVVDENRIAIKMRRSALLAGNVPADALDDSNCSTIEFTAAVDFKRRGVASKIVVPGLSQQNQASNFDPALIKAIARGRGLMSWLLAGLDRCGTRRSATGSPDAIFVGLSTSPF
jgi:site-specific DNA recombinase